MRRTLTPLVIALAAALGGCGAQASSAGDFEGEEKAVAEAVEDVQSAAERQNTSRLCEELLTKQLADRVRAGGASCGAEIEQAIDDSDDYELEVTDVSVSGARAQATVQSRNGERDEALTLQLAKEGDRWKVDSLGGQ